MGLLSDFVNFQKKSTLELNEFDDIKDFVLRNCGDKGMTAKTAQRITGKVVEAIERKIYGQTN